MSWFKVGLPSKAARSFANRCKADLTGRLGSAQSVRSPALAYDVPSGHSAIKAGDTVDFLLTAKRDRKAALRFLCKAIGQHGVPAKITIDKSTTNTAAIENYNSEHDTKIELRQVKYLNNVVE
jgi:DDE domain